MHVACLLDALDRALAVPERFCVCGALGGHTEQGGPALPRHRCL